MFAYNFIPVFYCFKNENLGYKGTAEAFSA